MDRKYAGISKARKIHKYLKGAPMSSIEKGLNLKNQNMLGVNTNRM